MSILSFQLEDGEMLKANLALMEARERTQITVLENSRLGKQRTSEGRPGRIEETDLSTLLILLPPLNTKTLHSPSFPTACSIKKTESIM